MSRNESGFDAVAAKIHLDLRDVLKEKQLKNNQHLSNQTRTTVTAPIHTYFPLWTHPTRISSRTVWTNLCRCDDQSAIDSKSQVKEKQMLQPSRKPDRKYLNKKPLKQINMCALLWNENYFCECGGAECMTFYLSCLINFLHSHYYPNCHFLEQQ